MRGDGLVVHSRTSADLEQFITGRIALDDLVEQGFDTLINHKDTAVKGLVHPLAAGA